MKTVFLLLSILSALSCRASAQSADWTKVIWRDPQVRYLLTGLTLNGSRDFHHRTAEAAHIMGCQEAVARFDGGVKVIKLDQFERKKMDGKVLITRKGSNERISGTLVKLSTD